MFQLFKDLSLPFGCQARKELVTGEIPGQPDTRRYDDIRPRAGAVEPLADMIAEIGWFHFRFFILSRNCAAVS